MNLRTNLARSAMPLMAALMAVSFSPTARAAIISVQFGCTAGSACAGANASSALQTGAALIGSPGDIWNLVSGDGGLGTTGTDVPLLDSNGDLTYAEVSWSSLLDWVVIPGQESGFGAGPEAALINSYLVSTGWDQITISGLRPGASYSLYMISQVPVFGDGRQAGFNVNGAPQVDTLPAISATSSFVEGLNYLLFNPQADGTGNISIIYNARNAEADVNGFQLSGPVDLVAPEPGGLGAGAGILAILAGWWRRRRRA